MTNASLSVTTVPCTCGFPQNAVQDERFPVRFDAHFNEYFFDHTLAPGDTLSIRLTHCPVCGGITAKSKRDRFFADLSDEEMKRIHERVGKYKSAEEIERSLGMPDIDEKGDQKARSTRILTYKNISKKADVRFTIYDDGKIEGTITPKYVGATSKPPSRATRRKKK
jgi:hypothetical protein